MKCKELKEYRKLRAKLVRKMIRTGDPHVRLKKKHNRLAELTGKFNILVHHVLND